MALLICCLSLQTIVRLNKVYHEQPVHKTPQPTYIPWLVDSHLQQIPLVFYLHGAGEIGNNLDKLYQNGPPKLMHNRTATKYILESTQSNTPQQCVVVCPQCPNTTFWNPENLKMILDELIEQFHFIDKNRIYGTGASMGSHGLWYVQTISSPLIEYHPVTSHLFTIFQEIG